MPQLTAVDSNSEPSEGKVDYFAPSYSLMQRSNHQCQFSLLFDTFFIQDTTNSFSATWPHQQANKSPSNTSKPFFILLKSLGHLGFFHCTDVQAYNHTDIQVN